MITLHCTKKLLVKLPLDESGQWPASAESHNSALTSAANQTFFAGNPLDHWHANLLSVQRRNCVLLVHNQTRFPLLLTCLVKKDFANFPLLFEDALLNTLLKLGANQTQLEAATKCLDTLVCNNQCDRSVQGSMNQMAQEIEHSLYYNQAKIVDASAYRLGAWLADSPRSIKGQKDYIWPHKAMLSLLDN